jgi:hypothetical protein
MRKCQYQKKGCALVENAVLTSFGKQIKKRLVDLDRTQVWLIDQVRQTTGRYFDRSYLHKIQTGRLTTPGMVAAICKILDLPEQN